MFVGESVCVFLASLSKYIKNYLERALIAIYACMSGVWAIVLWQCFMTDLLTNKKGGYRLSG